MPLRDRLRDDVAQARKHRDDDLAALLRTLITAIEAAELRQAADHYAQLGSEGEAARLRSRSEMVDCYAGAAD